MCGVAGIWQRQDQAPTELLRDMARRLAHRGPDDVGVQTLGPVGLAHTRLSIIDLAGGHQPLNANDGQLWLVANGEIYNHLELRAELEAEGCQFATRSDSEVILHAYAVYGDACLPRLRGMFAFALYDLPRRRLLLARDRLGIKPLFIAATAQGMAFASELKGLFPALSRRQVNATALIQYLQNQASTGRETMLHGVERLLPGEAMTIEDSGAQQRWCYWSAASVPPMDVDQPTAEEHFDGLMEEVMGQHMRADVPFGLFLSGGVDSGILLGLLSRYKEMPIRTYAVGFPGTELADELPAAEAMARRFSARHSAVTPDNAQLLERLPATVWAADELMRDYATLPTLMLAEKASKELKVVFTGEGGDEVFAGYGRYRAPAVERRLKSVLAPGTGGFRTSGDFRGRWPRRLFAPELAATPPWRAPLIEAWRSAAADWSDLQRMQYTDLTTALPDNLLVKVDRMLMSMGVEGRVPLLDHRVVEFGLALPDHLKVGPEGGKTFLRRWAQRYLPQEHLWGRKRGFHVPVGQWLQGPYLARMASVLADHPALTPWFKPAGVEALIRRQRRKGGCTRQLWSLLQFAVWHQIFIDGDGERPGLVDPVTFLNESL